MGGGEPSPSPGVSQPSDENATDQEAAAKISFENNASIVSGGGGADNGEDTRKDNTILTTDGASTLQLNKAIEPYTRSPLGSLPHEAAAAATANSLNGDNGGGGGLSSAKHAEEHVSRTYTKEEFMVRYWGVTPEQEKRVKALLRLGVNEDDLVIANRLLKLGRENSDTPWTKEEQLLGYTASQRQRIKALHTLGLTEGSLERCRALMLSSLGPSAFGADVDKTAKNAARAAEEEDWTPSDATRRWGFQSMNEVYGMLFKKKYSNDA